MPGHGVRRPEQRFYNLDRLPAPGRAQAKNSVNNFDGQRVYVTTGRGGTVVAIDATTNTPVGSVEVGTRPWGIAISPDGSRLHTANGPSHDVSTVDTASMSVVAKVPAGQSPRGVAIVPR